MPWAGVILVRPPLEYRDYFDDPLVMSCFLIMLVFCAAMATAASLPRPGAAPVRALRPLPRPAIAGLSCLAIATGALSILRGGAQWRYGDVSLSSSPELMLLAMIQYLLPVATFWVLWSDRDLILSRRPPDVVLRLLLLFANIAIINGLRVALWAFVCMLVLLFPRSIYPLLFRVREAGQFAALRAMAVLGVIVVLGAAPFFNLGLTAKSGEVNETAVDTYSSLDWLVGRHSVHLAIATAALNDGPDAENWLLVPNTFGYRMGRILGFADAEDRPEITLMARRSLLQFSEFVPRERSGASPGLLGTFLMLFPLVTAVGVAGLYCFVLARGLNIAFDGLSPLRWPGAFVAAYFPMRLVTDSPYDLLLPGPDLVILALILWFVQRRAPPPQGALG